ncbi:hypothetical protein DFJ77DRAFT_82106 [Powellomyces hirtus]|nr:hypothetical protein DFJ77DRAFT_82106 [Powellomyces hirtus]
MHIHFILAVAAVASVASVSVSAQSPGPLACQNLITKISDDLITTGDKREQEILRGKGVISTQVQANAAILELSALLCTLLLPNKAVLQCTEADFGGATNGAWNRMVRMFKFCQASDYVGLAETEAMTVQSPGQPKFFYIASATPNAPPLTPQPTSTAPAANNSPVEKSSDSKAPLIGGIVGGVLAIVILSLVGWWCYRRRRNAGAGPKHTFVSAAGGDVEAPRPPPPHENADLGRLQLSQNAAPQAMHASIPGNHAYGGASYAVEETPVLGYNQPPMHGVRDSMLAGAASNRANSPSPSSPISSSTAHHPIRDSILNGGGGSNRADSPLPQLPTAATPLSRVGSSSTYASTTTESHRQHAYPHTPPEIVPETSMLPPPAYDTLTASPLVHQDSTAGVHDRLYHVKENYKTSDPEEVTCLTGDAVWLLDRIGNGMARVLNATSNVEGLVPEHILVKPKSS